MQKPVILSTIITPPRRPRFGDKKPAAKKKAPAKKKAATKDTAGEPEAPKIPDHREDTQVAYQFTGEEISTMNHQLRQALTDIETLQSQKSAAVKDFALRIQTRTNETKQLRNKLDAGEETRPMRVAVDFDPKRSMKKYLHPETGAFIREEPMQPADWQLPLFREQPQESPAGPAATPAGKKGAAKPAKTSPVGSTSVGDALDKAAAQTKAAQFWIDLDAGDWTEKGLLNAFKKAAKAAKWTPPQISALADVLNGAEDVDAMIASLRPYIVDRETMFATIEGISVPKLDLHLEPGFPADKYRLQFRAAAKKSGWPEAALDFIDEKAIAIAADVMDEPEAGQKVKEYLTPYLRGSTIQVD